MPSALAVPDIVLGDRYGASAPPALTRLGGKRLCRCGLQRGAQRALCRRPHHRALWPGRRGLPCAADRDQPQRFIWTKNRSPAQPNFEAVKTRLTEALAQSGARSTPPTCAAAPCPKPRNNFHHSSRDLNLRAILREGFWWPGQERAERCGLNAHERRATPPASQKTRAKKWPLRGAAKFREETPRKGGGLAIEDRNTALQQYAEKSDLYASAKMKICEDFSRRNTGISHEILPDISSNAASRRYLCDAIKCSPVSLDWRIHGACRVRRNKRVARSRLLSRRRKAESGALSRHLRESPAMSNVSWFERTDAVGFLSTGRGVKPSAILSRPAAPAPHHLHFRHPSGHARLQGRSPGRFPGPQ